MIIDVPGISMCSKPRKDGRWQGHIVKDGITKYIYGGSKQELYDNIQKYIKSGSPAPKPKRKAEKPVSNVITLSLWINKWLELYKKPNVKHNTYMSLIQALKKPLEIFGDMPITSITTEELQKFFLSYTALRVRDIAISTIKMAMEKAKKQGLINVNPIDGVEIAHKKTVHKNALTPQEQETVLSAVKSTNYNVLFNVLLTTGLRIGEALALTDSDVDFEKKTVNINKTAVSISGKKVIQDSPKTAAGTRIVPVPDYVLKLLIGKKGQLFPISYNSVRLFFQRLSKKIGIKITPHIFRHTYATRLEEAGISPRLKQYLLGHASLEMTQNTYTDIQKDYIEKINSQISSIFLPRSEE